MPGNWTRERLQALADGPLINAIGGTPPRNPLAPGKRSQTTPRGYAFPPGTGPAGETCKSCKHIARIRLRSGKVFRKCELARERWTHGPGSDILAGAAACRAWERPANG